MALCPNGEGQPLTLKPCLPEDYNGQWEWIKGRLVDHGLSYMIDTDAKMTKTAKSIGFLLGYGEEKLAWRLISWLCCENEDDASEIPFATVIFSYGIAFFGTLCGMEFRTMFEIAVVFAIVLSLWTLKNL